MGTVSLANGNLGNPLDPSLSCIILTWRLTTILQCNVHTIIIKMILPYFSITEWIQFCVHVNAIDLVHPHYIRTRSESEFGGGPMSLSKGSVAMAVCTKQG